MNRSLRWTLWLLPLLCAGAGLLGAVQLDDESETFYRMARHFMTGDEEKVFRRLVTPELRREFIRAFWEIRDPDPNTEENEFRDEVETRFEFIKSHIIEGTRPAWETARGMVYMLLGPPTMGGDLFSPYGNDGQNGYIRWYYGEMGSFYVQFVDRQGFGIFELDMINTPLQLMTLLDEAKNRLLTGSERNVADRYLKFDAAYNAREEKLFVSVKARDLAFEQESGGPQMARLHISCNLYLPDGSIATRSEERRLPVDAASLQSGRLLFTLSLPLAKGRNRVDLLVADRVGGKMNRRMFDVRKK